MDCEQTIAYATDEYNAGHFYAVPSILERCMKDFTRDQRQRAYLLLTQTYLLLDDAAGARQSFLNVLEANPEFVTDERVHPIDVVYLSKRFTATPRFSWFVNAGTNVTPVRVIYDMNPMSSTSQKYVFRPGYNVGAGGELSIYEKWRVRVETNFMQTGFRHISDGHFRFGNEKVTGDRQSVIEQQTWINVPTYLVYSDNFGRYRPYGYAGISLSYMLSDKATITNTNIKFERAPAPGEAPLPATESFEMPSPNFDLTHARRRLGQTIVVGGGVNHKVGLDFVFVDVRYSFGLRNIVEPRYSVGNTKHDPASGPFVDSATPAFQYGYVSDYFRLDNLSVSVGFLRPLYKPRELKRARTKGVLRKLKRS